MSKYEIITDHKWKEFHYWDDVPDSIYKEYDWLDPQDKSDNWICYRKNWYHVSDFLSTTNKIHSPNNPFKKFGWHGYLSDSFFSGVLIELSDDCELYRIGTYIS